MAESTRIPTLALTGSWETLWEDRAREQLECEVLPAYLRSQRWFGGKGRHLEAARVADRGVFSTNASHVFLVLLEACFARGQSDLYFFPLGIAGGDAGRRLSVVAPSLRIARLTSPQGEASLHDALADEDTCLALLAAIEANDAFATREGQVRAFPTTAFAELRGDPHQPLSVERGPATSSNSLLYYGRRLLLKLFRRLEPGINPDFEIGRFLTEGKRFTHIPRVAGTLEYHRPGAEPITLAILQSFVNNEGDGWHHALEALTHYYQRVADAAPITLDARSLLERADASPPPVVEKYIGDYLHAAATLGRRTAEMHQAFVADSSNPDFAPEAFTPQDADALRASIRQQAETALAVLHDNLPRLPGDVIASARQLGERSVLVGNADEGNPLRKLQRHADAASISLKIRCHGDYHLGQVLRVQNDYVLLDFEGEPVKTIAERRARQSPLKDVAGMLRSYHYAAYAGLFAFTRDRPAAFGVLASWAELWFQWVAAAFLRAYRAAAGEAAFLPSEPVVFAALLEGFMLDKAFYELKYELNNRPDWVRIPLRGILALSGGSPSPGAPATK